MPRSQSFSHLHIQHFSNLSQPLVCILQYFYHIIHRNLEFVAPIAVSLQAYVPRINWPHTHRKTPRLFVSKYPIQCGKFWFVHLCVLSRFLRVFFPLFFPNYTTQNHETNSSNCFQSPKPVSCFVGCSPIHKEFLISEGNSDLIVSNA